LYCMYTGIQKENVCGLNVHAKSWKSYRVVRWDGKKRCTT